VKALGSGIAEGIHWPEIEVVNTPSGQPTIELHGKAAELLAGKCEAGQRAVVHLSLSDTDALAQAFVIIEVIPDDGA